MHWRATLALKNYESWIAKRECEVKPLTFYYFWRNSTVWVWKLSEVKHFSNLRKKSNEGLLVVASECNL